MEWFKLKLTLPSVVEDVEQLECQYFAGGNIKTVQSLKKSLTVCYKVKYTLAVGVLAKRNENMSTHRLVFECSKQLYS